MDWQDQSYRARAACLAGPAAGWNLAPAPLQKSHRPYPGEIAARLSLGRIVPQCDELNAELIMCRAMGDTFLTAKAAADALGVSVNTLYEWLAQSDAGSLLVRGAPFTIAYFQGGARGQGRISIDANEVRRLREAMRVRPCRQRPRRSGPRRQSYPGITVPLGMPKD